jgi:hypothetical protein
LLAREKVKLIRFVIVPCSVVPETNSTQIPRNMEPVLHNHRHEVTFGCDRTWNGAARHMPQPARKKRVIKILLDGT